MWSLLPFRLHLAAGGYSQPINWSRSRLIATVTESKRFFVACGFRPLVNRRFSSRGKRPRCCLIAVRAVPSKLLRLQSEKRFGLIDFCRRLPPLEELRPRKCSVFKRNKLLRPDADKADGRQWKLPKQSQLSHGKKNRQLGKCNSKFISDSCTAAEWKAV